MRKKIIPPYPTLNAIALEQVTLYASDGNELTPKSLADGSSALKNEGSPWIAQGQPLSISVEIESDVLSRLNCDIATILPAGAVAGIALSWQSKGSLRCGISDAISLEPDNPEQFAKLTLMFDSAEIRDTLTHQLVVFLQSSADENVEANKCNTPGTILGTGSPYTIRADGRGSVFPIFPIEGKDTEALWFLDCNWSDCMNDRFDGDSLRILINTKHRDCPEEWKSDQQVKLSALTKSIIRDAIATLILSVQREAESGTWNRITRTENLMEAEFAPGSIAHALWHLYNEYELNDETPAALMQSCGKIKL